MIVENAEIVHRTKLDRYTDVWNVYSYNELVGVVESTPDTSFRSYLFTHAGRTRIGTSNRLKEAIDDILKFCLSGSIEIKSHEDHQKETKFAYAVSE